MLTVYLENLKKICPKMQYAQQEMLSRHTSFRVGGPAALMLFPASEEELSSCVKLAAECGIKPVILGAGTNVLAPDEGLEQVVICLKERFASVERLDDLRLEACAGATLAKLAVAARDASLTGLEFAHGIPGTVGGGVYMNAGAYGGELSQVLESVTVMDEEGNLHQVPAEEAGLSYRHSKFQEDGRIVVKAVFRLQHGDKEAIHAQMQDYMQRRKASQPLELPSAGSTFKRPEGHFAGALIEQCGLKGHRVGGAAVSQKHAGFVVNVENATARDVKALIKEIQTIVQERFGVMLEPEVRIW